MRRRVDVHREQKESSRFQAARAPSIRAAGPRALPDLLRSAARHEPPFKSEDVAFRDAMVVMSVIEAVEKGTFVGLIADDNYFQDAAVQAAAKAKGVELVIFKTPQEAWAVVDGMARNDHDRLDEFLRKHLTVH